MLERFWEVAAHVSPIVGFNCRNFDLPTVLVRSMLLGVHVPVRVDLGRYGNTQVLDLMDVLYPSGCPRGHGLKPTCRMLGVDVPPDHGDGSQVYELYQQKDFGRLREYCQGDVEITRRLHRDKLAGYFCV
jgi:predicted PolB exonuclease-like 3'-5' exonuclease